MSLSVAVSRSLRIRYFVACIVVCKRHSTYSRALQVTGGKRPRLAKIQPTVDTTINIISYQHIYYVHRITPSAGQRFGCDPSRSTSCFNSAIARCTLLIAHCPLLVAHCTLHMAHIPQCAASVSPAVVSRWCVSASCRRRGGGDCGPCCRTAAPACRSLLGRRTGERGLSVWHTPSTGHRLL